MIVFRSRFPAFARLLWLYIITFVRLSQQFFLSLSLIVTIKLIFSECEVYRNPSGRNAFTLWDPKHEFSILFVFRRPNIFPIRSHRY